MKRQRGCGSADLRLADAEKLFAETLEGEKDADAALSAIVAKEVNAAVGTGEMHAGDDEAEEDAKSQKEMKGSKADEKPPKTPAKVA